MTERLNTVTRFRRLSRWARFGMGACGLLVVAFIVSTRYAFGFAVCGGYGGAFAGGCLAMGWDKPYPNGIVIADVDFLQWLPSYDMGATFSNHFVVFIPIWLVFLIVAVPTVKAWRRSGKPTPDPQPEGLEESSRGSAEGAPTDSGTR